MSEINGLKPASATVAAQPNGRPSALPTGNTTTLENASSFGTDAAGLRDKCKYLKTQILDLQSQNSLRARGVSRARTTVHRLQTEYALLLELLERKSFGLDIANAATLVPEDLDTEEIESLRLVDVTRLLTETPLAAARRLGDPLAGVVDSTGNAFVINGTTGKKKRSYGTSAAKRRLKDPNLPKRPTNAYLLFCELEKDNVRKEMDEKYPGVTTDMSKALTETWKNLDAKARKPFYELYEKDKIRYQNELKEYTERRTRESGADAVASTDDSTPAADAVPSSEFDQPSEADGTDAELEPPTKKPKLEVEESGVSSSPVTSAAETPSLQPSSPPLKLEPTEVL